MSERSEVIIRRTYSRFNRLQDNGIFGYAGKFNRCPNWMAVVKDFAFLYTHLLRKQIRIT
jgi:hypothetical protein